MNEGLARKTRSLREIPEEVRRKNNIQKMKSSTEMVVAACAISKFLAEREMRTSSTGTVYYTEEYVDYNKFLSYLVELLKDLGSSWLPEGDLIFKCDEGISQASIRDTATRASLVNMSNLSPHVFNLMKDQRRDSAGFFGRMCEAFLTRRLPADVLESMKKRMWDEGQCDSLFESINLGLNNKVKKKFNDADAVDNVAYIKFEDPEVERICHEHSVYSVDDARKVSSIKKWFGRNNDIKSFDEFKYFTGLKDIEECAFDCCESLQSINIPDSVTSIGYGAFSYCTSLQSFTIPDGVTSIGEHAFSYCTSLQSINIPNSVTSIGYYAFNECRPLQIVIIPNSVTSIGQGTFYDCISLQSINIPDGVTSIEYGTFYRCKSLQSINIPDSVTSIGNNAFTECSSLQSINIPDSVTSIGDHAFSYCASLQSINISNSVTSIEYGAFSECSSLQSVVIPNSVTSIRANAFDKCKALQSITIPDSVTNIGNEAFKECESLQSIYISKNCPVYDQIKKEYPNIQLMDPKVNESNLGLNNKVKKKFDDKTSGNMIEEMGVLDLEEFKELFCEEFSKIKYFENVYIGHDIGIGKFHHTFIFCHIIPSLKHTVNDVICRLCHETKKFRVVFSCKKGRPKKAELLGQIHANGIISYSFGVYKKSPDDFKFFTDDKEQADMTIPNVIEAKRYVEECLDDIVETLSLKEDFSLGLSKKVQKRYSEKSVDDIKELHILSPDKFKEELIKYIFENYNITQREENFDNRKYSNYYNIDKGVRIHFKHSGTGISIILDETNQKFLMYVDEERYMYTFREEMFDISVEGWFDKYGYNGSDKDDYVFDLTLDNMHRLVDFGLEERCGIKKIQKIEESNLGLNNKVKNKFDFDKANAVDNISDYIDLGLPNGTLWCKHNYGADENEYGGLYNHDDAKKLNLRPGILPSKEDFSELYDNCTHKWVTIDGTSGELFTSKINGNSVFFPAGGVESYTSHSRGNKGFYWASSSHIPVFPDTLFFDRNDIKYQSSCYHKNMKFSVRPIVKKSNENINLGLNNKVKKKFNDVDAVDTVSQIHFEDPEVERICHEHGVYTTEDASKVTSLLINKYESWFIRNEKIESFNEFKYFTGLERIEHEAFRYCTNLKSIILPDSITSIEFDAFNHCSSLLTINIPDRLRFIGMTVFYCCSSLKKIFISKNHIFIDSFKKEFSNVLLIDPSEVNESDLGLNSKVKKKFDNVDSVENVSQIPFEDPEVERICHEHGVYTYEDARKVSSIKGWFEENESIKSFNELKFFTRLNEIEAYTFSCCTALQSVIIPNSVTSIGLYAFGVCKSLQSVIIPGGVSSIEENAFSYCSKLQSVTIPNSVTIIRDWAFVGCRSLQSIIIPNSVTNIEFGSFYKCESLQSVTIPNSVTSIEESAFNYCKSLQSVTIPNSVTSIGEEVFARCENLQAINISKNCPVYNQIKKEYPDIQLIEPKVNEASNLGLSSKVKKKFDNVDAVDNLEFEFVDLGLPSGNMWAKHNVGSSDVNDAGSLLNHSEAVDAAFENRLKLPTKEDFKELMKYCHIEWVDTTYSNTSISGLELTSLHNGNKIFFPAGGHYDSKYNTQVENLNKFCYYWTQTKSDSKMPGEYFMSLISGNSSIKNNPDGCYGFWHSKSSDTLSVRLISISKRD